MSEKTSPTKSAQHQEEFKVAPADAGQRLDRFLALRLPEISRTHIQSLMDEGRVRVDGVT
ncbi:MAG: S4 domain-containing protein, partial [Candidatus Acidiferrales bacterium]